MEMSPENEIFNAFHFADEVSTDIYYMKVLCWIFAALSSIDSTEAMRRASMKLLLDIENPELLIVPQTEKYGLVEHEFSRRDIYDTPICGENITDIPHATWAYTARDGSVVTYTCDAGFQTSTGVSKFNYTCVFGQPLSSSALPHRCTQIACPKPEDIPNAEMIWKPGPTIDYGMFGSVVDFDCHVGYSGDGKARGPRVVKMVCGANGTFSYVLETITSCKLIHCNAPLTLSHATLNPSIDKYAVVPYGSTIDYACDRGFVVSTNRSKNSVSLSCGDDGEFAPNDPMPRCTESTCPAVPDIPHSATVHVAGLVKIDSRVIYRCHEGYYVSIIPMSETFNIRCDFINGFAQYVLPTKEFLCKGIACLPLPELEHAHVDGDETGWRFNETVPFSCEKGYALGGVKGENQFTGYCNAQGIWKIDENPNCAPVVCGSDSSEIPRDLLRYGTIAPFSATPIHYPMGTTITCVPGAVVVGTNGEETVFDITCGPDGDFLNAGLCALPCPPVPKVGHSTSKDFGRVVEYGEPAAVISCKPGYLTSQGSQKQYLTCSRDGKLTPIDPCVLVSGEHTVWDYEPREGMLAAAKRGAAASIQSVSGALAVSAILSIIF
jgi:hypothetical protein